MSKVLNFLFRFVICFVLFGSPVLGITITSKPNDQPKDQTEIIKDRSEKIVHVLVEKRIQNCILTRGQRKICCLNNCKIIDNSSNKPTIAEIYYKDNKISFIILK